MRARSASLGRSAVLAVMLAVFLTGCATASGGPLGERPASASPTPTPLYACPEMPGVELPPECAPYDPEASMAQNERYRERMEMSEDAATGSAGLADAARSSLEALRAAPDPITEDAVRTALLDAGASDVQLRASAGAVLFGAGVAGGCLYGAVDENAVSVELGGFILDGGCLPAQ